MEQQELTEPPSIPIQVSPIVEEEVHLIDLIPSSRQLVGCCRTLLWGIVETCVRQEALTETGSAGGLDSNENEKVAPCHPVNDETPFLDAQKQLLSDMVDLLGIPVDSNDENHSLPLQFGSKTQRSKGTKKTLKNDDQPPQQKKTRLVESTSADSLFVALTETVCLLLPVPHDEGTMIEENVYLARYDNSGAATTSAAAAAATSSAATSSASASAAAAPSTTTAIETTDANESCSDQAGEGDMDDALYPIRILGNGPIDGR